MKDQIKASDLFDKDLFTKATADAVAFKNTIAQIEAGIGDLLEKTKTNLTGNLFKGSEDIKNYNKDVNNSIVLEKQYIQLKQENEKLKREQIKTQAALNKESENAAKAEAKKAKATDEANSAYKRLSRQLSENKKAVKDLLASEKELTEADKKLISETQALDARLKKIDATLGDHQRNVGNYKEGIKSAFQEVGIFNTSIGRLAASLKDVGDKFKEGSKASGSFAGGLKGGTVGVILLAVAAFKELYDVNQNLRDGFSALIAKFQDFIFQTDKFSKAVESAQAWRYELLKLQDALQAVSLDEQDFLDISNDTTIGFKERNIALQEAIRLGRERAKINVEIARGELKEIENEIATAKANLATGAVLNVELLNKEAEAKRKLIAAEDALGDLVRENAKALRQRNIDEAIAAVELLQSKKLSYNEQEAQLQRQLTDEKKQLEERRKIARDLLRVQQSTVAEEIRLFKEKSGIQFDTQKILNETDAIKLKNQLESIKQLNEEGKLVGIGQAAIEQIAKIVKEYQENRIKNQETIAKLDDEDAKRSQKIATINKEIEIIEKERLLNKTINETQQQQDVFNITNRKKDLKKLLQLFDDEDTYRREILEKQAAIEKQNSINTINDKKELAETLRKIEAKLQKDLDGLDKGNDELKEKAKEEFRKKQIERAKQEFQTTLDFYNQIADARDERIKASIDRERSLREKNIEAQQQLAAKGLNNTLAFEKEAAVKAEKQQIELERKKEKRTKTLAFLKLLAGYADKNPDEAVTKAILQMALAEVASNAFKDGVENLQGAGTETSDSILARLSKGESVITAKATRENEGLATAMNEGKVDEYFKENLLPKYLVAVNQSSAEKMSSSLLLQQVTTLNQRMESIEKTLKERPTTQINIDNLGNIIDTRIKNGIIKQTKKQNNSRLNYL